MAGGSIIVNHDLTGTLVVSITRLSAGALTVYSDAALTTSVSMPDSITATKRYYLSSGDEYVISVKRNGYEIADSPDGTKQIRIHSDQVYSFSPLVDAGALVGLPEIQDGLASPVFTGQASFAAGTAPLPSITFTGDLDTGVWHPAANTVAISTAGAEAVRVNSSGQVGIGKTPTVPLDVVGAVTATGTVTGNALVSTTSVTAASAAITSGITAATVNTTGTTTANALVSTTSVTGASAALTGAVTAGAASSVTDNSASSALTVTQAGSGAGLTVTNTGSGNSVLVEDAASTDASPFVIDATGAVITGTTASLASVNNAGTAITPRLEVVGTTATPGNTALYAYGTSSATNPNIVFNRSKGSGIGSFAVVASADPIGSMVFAASDGTQFVRAAMIQAFVDATPGTNDMPGRLVFSTTPDGAAAPVEVMRLDNTGLITGSGPSLGAYVAYTPTLGGFTLGNGTITGKYSILGKRVEWSALLTFGSTSAGAAALITFTLPQTRLSTTVNPCFAQFYDVSATTYYGAVGNYTSTTVASIGYPGANGVWSTPSTILPFTWATGDMVMVSGFFEAA